MNGLHHQQTQEQNFIQQQHYYLATQYVSFILSILN